MVKIVAFNPVEMNTSDSHFNHSLAHGWPTKGMMPTNPPRWSEQIGFAAAQIRRY
jgi:hypothetical protein